MKTEGGFTSGESGSIVHYLAETNRIPDHWYPKVNKEEKHYV